MDTQIYKQFQSDIQTKYYCWLPINASTDEKKNTKIISKINNQKIYKHSWILKSSKFIINHLIIWKQGPLSQFEIGHLCRGI